MTEAPFYAADGARRKSIALPADLFDGRVNEAVLHRAVVTYLANQRQGTHATKTRGLVSGGGRKPWRQKGTGRARQGSTRAPHWRGGGTAFGPTPRDHRLELPRTVRRLARRSALNARAREAAVHVIERFAAEVPKTRAIAALLEKLGVAGQPVLLLTAGHNENVWLSARNIPDVAVRPFAQATAYEILRARHLVIEEGALSATPLADEEGEEAPAPAVKRTTRKTTTKKASPRKAPASKARAAKATRAKAPAKDKHVKGKATKAAGKRKPGGKRKES